jgi:hydrogenase expression/formation protein HypD
MYTTIVNNFRVGCVVSGFEPTDLLQTILMLIMQIETKKPRLEIQYKRAVTSQGNIKAKQILKDVFELKDDWWRGLGIIQKSGLKLNKTFKKFDVENAINIYVAKPTIDTGCICGEILKGLQEPTNCPLFKTRCNPANPVGACMVSSEGACQAFYRYHQ